YSPAALADTMLLPETLAARLAAMTVLVALDPRAQIIGTIAFRAEGAHDGHLRGMAVLPSWQGSGAAERLLEAACAALREQGCAGVTLDTTAPLRRAIGFYQKHGFRATGRVDDYFGMALYEYSKPLR